MASNKSELDKEQEKELQKLLDININNGANPLAVIFYALAFLGVIALPQLKLFQQLGDFADVIIVILALISGIGFLRFIFWRSQKKGDSWAPPKENFLRIPSRLERIFITGLLVSGLIFLLIIAPLAKIDQQDWYFWLAFPIALISGGSLIYLISIPREVKLSKNNKMSPIAKRLFLIICVFSLIFLLLMPSINPKFTEDNSAIFIVLSFYCAFYFAFSFGTWVDQEEVKEN